MTSSSNKTTLARKTDHNLATNTSLIISGYSAVLATSLAGFQVFIQRRDRPQIRVSLQIPHSYNVGDMVTKPRGTVIRLEVIGLKRVLEIDEIFVRLVVRNHGRRAIQLVSASIEAIANDQLAVFEIFPKELPHSSSH